MTDETERGIVASMDDEMVNAILGRYGAATANDIRDGLVWYARARKQARKLGRAYGYSLTVSAGVIAALSPRQKWGRNLETAAVLLSGRKPTGVFGRSIRAAESIRDGARAADILRGPKVSAFRANILGDYSKVTVDVWASRAAGYTGTRTISTKTYGRIAAAYTRAAEIVGIPPAVLQATVWCVERGKAE